MHAAFVDFSKAFSKAFDSVNHEALWEVLETRGIHPKLISLIKDLYEGNRVRVAGQWADNFFGSNSHQSAKRVALWGSRVQIPAAR